MNDVLTIMLQAGAQYYQTVAGLDAEDAEWWAKVTIYHARRNSLVDDVEVLAELKEAYTNLASVQKRCTELLEETRVLRRQLAERLAT